MIDGQGGGIGATLIKYLKEAYDEKLELIALGTNAIATAQMMKSGANRGGYRVKMLLFKPLPKPI